ncbi:MAG: class I SAM-dependent methyltransferase [Thermoanaerobaculia bacterium]
MVEAASFWDREVHEPVHTGWMTIEPIRFYINERIAGDRHLWPLDWFQRRYPRRFARVLSIGCGTGALERDLVRRGVAGTIDAFDGSVASIAIARGEAANERLLDRIRYFAADFNRPSLPRRRYDAVFMHQSLHHVEKLEKLLMAVLLALKPDGVLYLDEYIGPSRTFWNDETVAPYRARYQRIPRAFRRSDELPLPIQPDDPTEAFRSGEIAGQLAIGFRTVDFRGYGGAILSVIGAYLHLGALPAEMVRALIESDRAAARDFYAIIVATPKRGPARETARLRYYVEPKLKRIGRAFLAIVPSRRTRRRDTAAASTTPDLPTT